MAVLGVAVGLGTMGIFAAVWPIPSNPHGPKVAPARSTLTIVPTQEPLQISPVVVASEHPPSDKRGVRPTTGESFKRSQKRTEQLESGAGRRTGSSAYCGGGTTASGKPAAESGVASNAYPLGTKLRITSGPEAGREVTVTDRHSKRYGSNLVDLYFDSCARAAAYGRRSITVERR